MRPRKIIILILVLQASLIFAQNSYDLEAFAKKDFGNCERCIQIFKNTQPEIQYGLDVDLNNNIIFYVNRAEWFYSLIKKGKDGIAVDIVLKEDFGCSSDIVLSNQAVSLGTLIEPFYFMTLKKNSVMSERVELAINLGQLPKKYLGEDYDEE